MPNQAPAAQLNFPPAFLWGVSTSSYQFEGGNEGSNWSDWERASQVRTGDRSGLACDWWRNTKRDFDLAQDLGLNALRMSLEWSRIEPREGQFDAAALERYRGMLGELRERGIRPFVTLHHFTHPRWFEAEGAFLSPRAVERFARFSEHATRALSDLCTDWLTFNEPNVYAVQGYLHGEFPPGKKDLRATLRVFDQIAHAHAAAYRAMHGVRSGLSVGLTQHLIEFAPENEASRLDRMLARVLDSGFNDGLLTALLTGEQPWFVRALGGNTEAVRNTLDFVGLNIYGRQRVGFDARRPGAMFMRRSVPADAPQGDQAVGPPFSECRPSAIGTFARRYARFSKPLYILENGVPDRSDRIRPWLVAHAAHEVHQLLTEGVDLGGYFHWSLVDNFEWTEGWNLRFGLAALDVNTQERTLRGSGKLYRAIARHRALRRVDVKQHAPSALNEIFPPQPLSVRGAAPRSTATTRPIVSRPETRPRVER